jgi:hypothetical protein
MDIKKLGVWLVFCLAAAGVTIVATQALDKSLGLQQKVATFGK